jgi:hypothetical protein
MAKRLLRGENVAALMLIITFLLISTCFLIFLNIEKKFNSAS